MSLPIRAADAHEWRRFYRSTLRKWRGMALLRAMDRPSFDQYSDESLIVQESLGYFAAGQTLPDAFILEVSSSVLRLISHMYFIGDDITAFILARALGDLQEDRGL